MLTFLNDVVIAVAGGVVLAVIAWATRVRRRRWESPLREWYSLWKHRNARLKVYGFDQHGNPTVFSYDNPVARAAHKLGIRARWQRLRSEFPDLFSDLPPDVDDRE